MSFRRSRTRSRKNSLSIVSNSEKWKSHKKSVTRYSELESDSDEDVMKASELKDWVDEFFIRKSLCVDTKDQDVEIKLTRKQTLILSTLVPDEILLMDQFDALGPKRFVGVLLMADVSGYTALSEKYNNAGKTGTYQLTATLNRYLGSLIEVIYSHGGDIIKFAGDAFLALWKLDKRSFLCHTIHTAIACALVIQHAYGSFETDVKVNLKVKLAISAGNLIFAPIGSGVDMSYVIIGLPVLEAKKAESLCASGEVKVTPTAWGHCYSRNYVHVIDDDDHVTIKAILYDPHEENVNKPFSGFPAMLRQVNKPQVLLYDISDFLFDPTKKMSNVEIARRNELLNLRKTILLGEEKNIGSEIRKFMIRPVLTQIDAHQPLEYLTEMREVSVLFITLKPKVCPSLQVITIVNNAYQITCEIVYKSMGCVNKIILFDKDIMILVIFGLRGFKHESEAQAALKCAYNVKKSISALDGVLEVSIGVTTGKVYCGVVGHPLRREFTVIGAVVNKAARFMCSFRNKVTCDEATYLSSKLSSNGFTLQPPTELKGIKHPGKIYEYSEDIRLKQLFDISIIPPLLNREHEMEYYMNWLNNRGSSYRDYDALLLIGESRVGKTRLLEWMLRYARNTAIKTCYINLTSIHSATPYLALSQIINQILDLNEPLKEFEKEKKIVNILKYYSEDLCYLNKILKVRFAYREGTAVINEEDQKEKTKHIFNKFIKSLPHTYAVFIDDLQNLDEFSWEFISLILDEIKIFTVLTVTRGKFQSMHAWFYTVYLKSNIRKIVLNPLKSLWIPPLACQILDVIGVPKDLCEALVSKCNGMPGQVETFILHLFSCGALDFIKINKEEVSMYKDLYFPDPTQIQFVALESKDQPTLDRSLLENESDDVPICLVSKKDELNTDINVLNLDALIMIQLDSLTPYQQLLVKIASVIGNVFSRDLLENIMYENDIIITAKAIKRLFSMRIISCANVKRKQRITLRESIPSGSFKENLTCECGFEYDPDLNENLPKYAFCKVMKFKNKNSRKIFYELLPLNQKKEFHTRVVNYLENNKQKCYNCGGSITIVHSATGFQIDDHDINKSVRINNNSKVLEKTESSSSEVHQLNDGNDINAMKTSPKTLNEKQLNEVNSDKQSSKFPNYIFLSKNKPKEKNRKSPYFSTPANKINENSEAYETLQLNELLEQPSENQNDNNNDAIFDNVREIIEAQTTSDWNAIGIVDSEDTLNKEKEDMPFPSIKLEPGISQTNFTKCTCIELNISIYEQLIHHAKEAELKDKVIEFLIAFSYLNILALNPEDLTPKLDEAENLCHDRSTNFITKFQHKIYLGRIYSLKASSNLLCGKYMAAKLDIEKALKIYGLNFIKVKDFLNIKAMITTIHFKRPKYRDQAAQMKSDSIFCFNVATSLYSAIKEETLARLAAQRALFLSHSVQCNVIDLCDAFYNIIELELDRGMTNSTIHIEKIAKKTLLRIRHEVQLHEMFAVGKFFLALFTARMAKAHLSSAIRSGYQALALTQFLCVASISMDIIPNLYYLLLSRCRIKEAVEVVKLLLHVGSSDELIECQTWYNALCMDLILDAGIQIETPEEINDFALYALRKGRCVGQSRRRLVLSLWTYWLRTDESRAKNFENEALSGLAKSNDDNSLKTLISCLRLAEGMLESLARKVDDLCKVVDLMELRSLAEKELNALEEDVLNMRTIYPRWILLKAYSLSLSGRTTAADSLFQQALEEARQSKNRLEEAAARAAISNSQTWINNAHEGLFLNWQNGIEYTRTSWHQLLYKITSKR